MASVATAIRDQVESTRFIDTHEHLPDESSRLNFKCRNEVFGWDRVIRDKVDDWSFLFVLYLCDDLCSAGLPFRALQRFWGEEAPAERKFDLIAEQWRRVRHTGYGQAMRHTLRILYGEEDLTRQSAPRIAERYFATRIPGFYDRILREVSRVEHCHVNSFESLYFRKTEAPSLLRQDIDMTSMTDPASLVAAATERGVELTSLEGWLEQIDEVFRVHGPRASAVKLQTAYTRNLSFAATDQCRAEYAFQRFKAQFSYSFEEQTALHDFLMRYAIRRATEAGLMIKFHTGIGCAATLYGDATPIIPLARVRDQQSELCQLYREFPDARFVIFHIGYPYQNEVVAAAKQYHNVYVDMCWAWILDPVSCVPFLRSFLTTAPYNKLFTFGGDNLAVEAVVGHAHIARNGIGQALTSLIDDRWLAPEEAPELIEALMRGNALAAFGDAAKC